MAAGVAHAAMMAAVHEAAFPDNPWSENSFAVLLAQPGVAGLVDDRGGILLLRVAADEAEILTVAAAVKRQGIGRALLNAALAQARMHGAAKIFLEVAAGNAAARALYNAAGFAEAGLRRAYYADGGDALILQRAL